MSRWCACVQNGSLNSGESFTTALGSSQVSCGATLRFLRLYCMPHAGATLGVPLMGVTVSSMRGSPSLRKEYEMEALVLLHLA